MTAAVHSVGCPGPARDGRAALTGSSDAAGPIPPSDAAPQVGEGGAEVTLGFLSRRGAAADCGANKQQRTDGVSDMNTITTTATSQRYEQATTARDHAAHVLYEAELALHDAHQSHIDAWITAASDRLHVAVVAHLEAEARVRQSVDPAA